MLKIFNGVKKFAKDNGLLTGYLVGSNFDVGISAKENSSVPRETFLSGLPSWVVPAGIVVLVISLVNK